MSLVDRLLGIGVSLKFWISWTGAGNDECLKPGCGVRRDKHVKLDHHFVEEK